jgi:hypothetical protein
VPENTTYQREFLRAGRHWVRREPEGFSVCVARYGDVSAVVECNTNYLPGHAYDAHCSCCYLGHTHSREMHDQSLLDYTTTHREAIQ